MVCLIAPVTNNSDVQDSQKPGSVCFKRGLVPRTYPYWARLLHRCTVRPMTVRVSLLVPKRAKGCNKEPWNEYPGHGWCSKTI
eukprot:1195500-Prorocentrum_minimum.AAC.21